ncbi:MAG: N-acetylmuramoyl-L-alanine amidase [Desulfobacteraceae bacterium]|nr:N-acetylmuramoyl-L-alanine amidase [Desulfobacteraceae bacterium]
MRIILKVSIYATIFFCSIFLISSIVANKCYADVSKDNFLSADACYKVLRNSPSKMKYRHNWINCINKYQKISVKTPKSGWAPAGMYRAAQLYLQLYKRSSLQVDRKEAVDLLIRVKKKYPKSAYRYRADRVLESLLPKTTLKNHIAKKQAVKKKAKPTHLPQTITNTTNETAEPGGDTFVTGLRFWSNPEYTRIVIDAQKERNFTYRLLKKDPSINIPFQRLYVDIHNSRLATNFPEHTPIDDDLLKRARAGQYAPHSVRVVVDIKSFKNYKIFALKDPFRIVMDIWGVNGEQPLVAVVPTKDSSTQKVITDNLQSSSIAKQLALGVRKIVIDPGHGGRDPGAPGYIKNVWEKDITLKLAKQLAAKLKEKLNCEVLLTRTTDKYISLEERTAIANTKKADLFISLHCNASKSRKLKGFETYFLNLATDDQAIAVAARENATSRKNISDLESILNDLMQNAKIKESSRLASLVQNAMVSNMKKKYTQIVDLGVKQAPFYVLIGARMPAILIETSFLSNKTECKRMISDKYRENVCNSITSGVEKYIKTTNPKRI